jgi:hypothetical protein
MAQTVSVTVPPDDLARLESIIAAATVETC